MKRIILISIFLCSYWGSVSQEPNKEEALNAIHKIKVLHLSENDINRHAEMNNSEKIRIIKDNFTENETEECLVIVPMTAGHFFSEWVLLMKKNVAGYWVYGNWYNNSANKIDVIDVDDDNLKEIVLEGGFTNQGYIVNYFSLISIKNGEEKKLYEYQNFDASEAFSENRKPGDTISITTEVQIINIDTDKKKEIEELTAFGILQEENENGPVQNYYTIRKTFFLKDGIYKE